jgi:hypothetical protein
VLSNYLKNIGLKEHQIISLSGVPTCWSGPGPKYSVNRKMDGSRAGLNKVTKRSVLPCQVVSKSPGAGAIC